MKEDVTPSPLQSSEEKSSSFATIRLMGNLGKLGNGRRLDVEKIATPLTVGRLLEELQKSTGLEFRRDSTLVLVNGVEANALQDLDTLVVGEDEVALVPMFHGGEV
jgi:molybdopterin converting factor small subunit